MEPNIWNEFSKNRTFEMETDAGAFNRTEENASVPPGDQSNNNSNLIFNREDLFFDMSKKKILIIFNHYEFKKTKENGGKPTTRKGTANDVKSLRNTFEAFGFDVTAHQDLDHVDIKKYINEVSKLDPERTSCIAIAVLTHGENQGKLYAADQPYPVGDLYGDFLADHCSLANVPKLFFIQACRGKKLDSGRIVTDSEISPSCLPTHANFLFLYSTAEDHVSWREQTGGWLIQSLCKTLDEYSGQFDLLWMLTIVHQDIAKNYSSYTLARKTRNKKQMPETRFSLIKLLRF